MEALMNELNTIANDYTERGAREGFDAIWPELERRLRAMLEPETASKQKVLPIRIEQQKKKVDVIERHRASLLEDRLKARQALRDGWSAFYHWLSFVLWWSGLLGETLAFPFLYRDVFDLPLFVGFGFCALFPGASFFVKGIYYVDLLEHEKRRFRRILAGAWGFSMVLFTLSFLTARGMVLAQQTQSLSLSGSTTDPLSALRIVSLIGLWLFGLTTAIGLAIIHVHYRSPQTRLLLIDTDLREVEQELEHATDTYLALIQEVESAQARVEAQILSVKNEVQTLIQERREEDEMLRRKFPRVFGSGSHNGQASGTKVLPILLLLATTLLIPWKAFAGQPVFLIQDLTRSAQLAEKDFQGFGQLVLTLPIGGTLTVVGSDGVQYIEGRIDGEYQGKVQRQRQALISQGRQLYQRMQTQPGRTRDYATALSEILPRLTTDAIVIVQGKPLYRLDPIDWEGRVPSVSWAFHALSPFGETALRPAPVRFRVGMIFDAHDFVSPNHRAELQRFWTILFERLNGNLTVFTSDPHACTRLLTSPASLQGSRTPMLPTIPVVERQAPLQLHGITVLGIAK